MNFQNFKKEKTNQSNRQSIRQSNGQSIRQKLCDERLKLTRQSRQEKAKKATQQFVKHMLFLRSERIGIYWPIEGEMDPYFIQEKARQMHKKCYLPVLHPFQSKKLLFSEYRPGDPLHFNRYRIMQPYIAYSKPLPAWHLDVVLVPVVGFDKNGHRYGRGAGYYDRTFAYLQRSQSIQRPKLIGLAYQFQQIEDIPLQSWDIPLDGVITEQQLILL